MRVSMPTQPRVDPTQRLLEIDPALLEDGQQREQWEAITDLDSFFTRIYTYYHERGLRCILASRVISLLTLAFTIMLVFFIVEFLNIDDIIYACQSEQTCQEVSLIRTDWLHHSISSPFAVVYYYLLFTLYWLWMLLHFVWELRPLFETRTLYRDKLHLEDADLQVVAWDEVVVKLVELQRTARLCIVKDQLTAHDVANRILRKENFLVALVNQNLLPLQPFGPSGPSVMTKTLEWNLYVTILDAMFDKHFRIRQSFTLDVGALRRRFLLCGCANILLAPFMLAFMLFFVFLKHAEEFSRRAASTALRRLGSSDYSRHARWTMREFNELPHVFEARLAASSADANAYVKQFPAPLTTLLARFATFVVSSAAAVLLLLSIFNEKFLLYYRWPPEAPQLGFNLLWWLAMLSTILAVSRSFDDLADEAAILPVLPDALLQSVARHTHYMPQHWRGRGHTRQVYAQFRALYQYRVWSLLQEVFGAITAPMVMLLVLPQRAGPILEFIRSFTVYVEGVGHVCSFALFDFERHGDVRYGAPLAGVHEMRSRDGKMEKAYVNFRAQHPSWRDDRGEALLINIAGGNGSQHVAASPKQSRPPGASDGVESGCHASGDSAAPVGCGVKASPAASSDLISSQFAVETHRTPSGVAGPLRPPEGSQATQTFSHSVKFAPQVSGSTLSGAGPMGGASALGDTCTMGAMAGFGASAFGTSALQMLACSSMHLDLQHRRTIGDSIAPLLEDAQVSSSAALAYTNLGVSLVPHYAPHGASAAMNSEARTRHLTAGLYSQLDRFYTRIGGGSTRASEAATSSEQTQHDLESPLPPGLPTDQSDYELQLVPARACDDCHNTQASAG